MAGWNTLVQPETLLIARQHKRVVVLDCRHDLSDPEAGQRAWMHGHLPGAEFAHLDRHLSCQLNQPGQGRHPWPQAERFIAQLGAWGIDPETQVVAYDDADGAFASRLWWLLRSLGHERVAVLDGGFKRWVSLSLPTNSAHPKPEPEVYPYTEFDHNRVLDTPTVRERLAAGDLLIDARGQRRFLGIEEPIDHIAGHIPGAVNRPYTENLARGMFKPPVSLEGDFRDLLSGHSPDRTIVMCGSGVTACHHLLAMERAGMPGAALYAPSWSGWISDPSNPVEASLQ